MLELGMPQEKIDRIRRIGENMFTVPDGLSMEVWILGKRQELIDILIEGLDTASAFKVLKAFQLGSFYRERAREYAQRAVDENPDFLEGRLYLVYRGPDDARSAAEYREILRDFPDSIGVLTGLGLNLVMDHPVEAIYHLKRANRINPSAGLAALGRAYQRLGDYKTAWVYLKKAQTYPHGPLLDDDVEMIEAGTPMIEPLQQASMPRAADPALPDVIWDPFPDNTTVTPEPFRDNTGWSEKRPTQSSSEQKTVDSERERAASAKRAHEEFLKHQELSQKELNDFLQWAETIMNAESPMDTNNFLMKEMEAHLKGGKAQFTPDRIIRAFEMMERHGQNEGMKRLQKNDPELAAQVQRLLEAKRPPRRK